MMICHWNCLLLNVICEKFGLNMEACDIDLAVHIGSSTKTPRTVMVTMVCWMKWSSIASGKVLDKTDFKKI